MKTIYLLVASDDSSDKIIIETAYTDYWSAQNAVDELSNDYDSVEIYEIDLQE